LFVFFKYLFTYLPYTRKLLHELSFDINFYETSLVNAI